MLCKVLAILRICSQAVAIDDHELGLLSFTIDMCSQRDASKMQLQCHKQYISFEIYSYMHLQLASQLYTSICIECHLNLIQLQRLYIEHARDHDTSQLYNYSYTSCMNIVRPLHGYIFLILCYTIACIRIQLSLLFIVTV